MSLSDARATLDRLRSLVSSNQSLWTMLASSGTLQIKPPAPPKPAKTRESWREASELIAQLDQMLRACADEPAPPPPATTPPPPPPPPPPEPEAKKAPVFVVSRAAPMPEGTVIPDGYEWFRDRVTRSDRAELIRLLENAHRHHPLGLIEQDNLITELREFLAKLDWLISDPSTKRQIHKLLNSPDQHLIDNLVQDMRLPCQNTCSMAGHHAYDCKTPSTCNHRGCMSKPDGQIGYLIRVPMMVAAELQQVDPRLAATGTRFYKIVY